ncbi:DNA-binding FrmR family transcriptional regulator [Desulfohalotomaculum tongense]|uniref:metal-sensitive transcriptional regulator n=1 Tax=Desulforadius tongensis TaxID=1216062 RepID=UPI00195DB31B|nr:metal-sensitive transcriptional regulator [Desulforadius tongensis]MBM7854589.1 DNA-binding FrmR family transcriptional regulator [Desulforadius tongensis]
MGYTPDNYEQMKTDLQSRLKRIEGQVRGVQKMIAENRPCGEIVIQLGAIKAAVNRVGFTVLACHLAGGIKEGLEKGEDVAQYMDEFMQVLKKFS